LGFLLLDDRFVAHIIPQRWRKSLAGPEIKVADISSQILKTDESADERQNGADTDRSDRSLKAPAGFHYFFKLAKLSLAAILLGWSFYATTAELLWMFYALPLPTSPVAALEPFRIANRYGLFGIMTRGRYEIEFQGSDDGKTWLPYPFRYKPQDLDQPPGIYAPYQPRFDWNLWFASLGSWQEYPIVPRTEVSLLSNDKDVLDLFESNPFPNKPPREVRAVIWQYWFTTMSEKRRQGLWWRREFVGLYAPTVEREPDGTVRGIEWPNVGPRE